jgi:hypothetical protein
MCLDTKLGLENRCTLPNSAYVGWADDYDRAYITQLKRVGLEDCFPASSKARRDLNDLAEAAVKKERFNRRFIVG